MTAPRPVAQQRQAPGDAPAAHAQGAPRLHVERRLPRAGGQHPQDPQLVGGQLLEDQPEGRVAVVLGAEARRSDEQLPGALAEVAALGVVVV